MADNLESPRIDRRFVNSGGNLTDTAYAFLYKLWRRSGGAAGDEEIDLHSVDTNTAALFLLADSTGMVPSVAPLPFPEDQAPTYAALSLNDLGYNDPETRDKLAELVKRVLALEMNDTLEQLENQIAQVREFAASVSKTVEGIQQS